MPHCTNLKSLKITLLMGSILAVGLAGVDLIGTTQPVWGQSNGAPGEVPIGTILPYSGSLEALPSNWVLCDGRTIDDPESPLRGTAVPDLTDDRFLMGVGAGTSVGVTGGVNEIVTDGSHGHRGEASDRVTQKTGSPRYLDTSGNKGFKHTHSLSIQADGRHNHGGDNRPNFYSVRFIIRVR